jgi:hypothetical protein
VLFRKTGYCFIFLVMFLSGRRSDIMQTIEPESGPFGEFTAMVYCNAGTWAIGFRQRVEPSCGSDCDDTALNALELLCGRKDGTYVHSMIAHDGY